MPNRHRLPYAALGGYLAVILGISLALAQEPQKVVPPVLESQPKTESGQQAGKSEATDQGQKKKPAAEKLSPSLNRIESAIRDLIAQQRAAQGKGPEQHEISDLKAQEGMAFWAKTMFWATVAAVVITFIGILLIKRTLEETKRAAIAAEGMLDEAKETTKAAQAAIEATSKTAERQLRAYVQVENIQLELPPAAQVGGRKFVIVINIKNSGQTPAKDHRVRGKYFFAKEYESSRFGPFSCMPETGPAPISPQGTSAVTIVPDQTGKDWQNFTNGNTRLFVYGQITYQDAFENKWETTFRMVKDYDIVKAFSVLPEGNECT